jgi:hypothetical protein
VQARAIDRLAACRYDDALRPRSIRYSIPRPGTPAAQATFPRDENAKWSKTVAVSGAQVD